MGVSCGGSASTGAVGTQLQAVGAADLYLTFNAKMTLWRARYNKHTNFAMESLEQPFNTQVSFGQEAQCVLNRTGDLIYFMYVVIDLPGITGVKQAVGTGLCGGNGADQFPWAPDTCDACCDGAYPKPCALNTTACAAVTDYGNLGSDCGNDDHIDETKVWAHWTNAIGQYLVKQAVIVVGGQIVDTLYNDYLFMWEELSGKPGKRLTEMIGKRATLEELIEESAETRRLYVPLPFWFTQNSGNALPLVSLQFHGVQVHVCFESLKNCIQVSGPGVTVLKSDECTPITSQDLRARLDTTYVYLDIEERDRFATGSFEQLITQVQRNVVVASQQQVAVQLNFNHPIIELIWAVRRRCQEVLNNHFNFSGKHNKDPLEYVHLKLNNLPRFQGREARYFRLVQPYQFHTNIPDAFVYCFSFALHPEAPQPSGSCNFSRIDNVEMVFELQSELFQNTQYAYNPYGQFVGGRGCAMPQGGYVGGAVNTDPYAGQVSIIIIARNWQIFRFRSGLAGRAFN